MEISILLIIGICLVLIWGFSWMRDHKQKFFVFLLVFILIIGAYAFHVTFSGKNIQINSVGDFGNAVKLYFSWFANAFRNIQVLTVNAIKLDWKGNQTSQD
jgi:hypothetical protein